MEHVILVDEEDREIGTMEKLEAHQKGRLHRAFSVLIFNSKGEILLQKRAQGKYHSAGLWTNTCCSHPLPGESMEKAIRRKLMQEMGFETTAEFAYKFLYRTQLSNLLIEHEYDHVYIGTFDGKPEVNPSEVESWRYISMDQLREEVKAHPERFTFWFKQILEEDRLPQAR